MPSLRNAFIKTISDLYEGGQTVFFLEELLRETYPNVPLEAFDYGNAASKLLSAMQAVERDRDIFFIPLSESYFANYRQEQPESEDAARQCVAGAAPRTGRTVGFKVPDKDLITKVWTEHGRKSAIAHANGEWKKHSQVAEQLGLEGPVKRFERELLKITEN